MKKAILLIVFSTFAMGTAFSQISIHTNQVYDNINKDQQNREKALPKLEENNRYSLLDNPDAAKLSGTKFSLMDKLTLIGQGTNELYQVDQFPVFHKAEYSYGIFLLHTPATVKL